MPYLMTHLNCLLSDLISSTTRDIFIKLEEPIKIFMPLYFNTEKIYEIFSIFSRVAFKFPGILTSEEKEGQFTR